MDTLRVFTTRKKNCYSLNGEKGGQILVRASFLYGNYDKKSSPPTFDLQFDGNEWTTVVTSNDGVVTYEAIYVTKGDLISVCVAQTKPAQFPFISALQIHSLDSNMYNKVDSNYALFLESRVAYGADAIVRYACYIYIIKCVCMCVSVCFLFYCYFSCNPNLTLVKQVFDLLRATKLVVE